MVSLQLLPWQQLVCMRKMHALPCTSCMYIKVWFSFKRQVWGNIRATNGISTCIPPIYISIDTHVFRSSLLQCVVLLSDFHCRCIYVLVILGSSVSEPHNTVFQIMTEVYMWQCGNLVSVRGSESDSWQYHLMFRLCNRTQFINFQSSQTRSVWQSVL